MSNHIDPHWVSRHLDAELLYIVQATISTLPTPVSFRTFSDRLAEAVADVIHERVPQSAALFAAADLKPLSSGVFRSIGGFEGFKANSFDKIAGDLSFAWLTYIHALLLGAPSPRAKTDCYWPFGNEGGFCNPIKLKHLAEEAA